MLFIACPKSSVKINNLVSATVIGKITCAERLMPFSGKTARSYWSNQYYVVLSEKKIYYVIILIKYIKIDSI